MSYRLAGAVAITDQTINLTSAYTLPGGSYPARIRVDSETMLVRGGAGTSFLSVQRGADGTAPAAHAVDSLVYDDTDTDERVGDITAETVTVIGPDGVLGLAKVVIGPADGVQLRFLDADGIVIGEVYSWGGWYNYGGNTETLYFSDTSAGGGFNLSKYRGPLEGPYSIVQSGDTLGIHTFRGYDGATERVAAYIAVAVDGTPGSGDMPGRMSFATTADGAASSSERLRITNAGTVQPGADNTQPLGAAGKRWSVVYAGTGTINTSDAGAKQDVKRIGSRDPDSEALLAVARRLSDRMASYRMKDAVEKKGDGARIHHGITAQDVEAAFRDEGLDPARYGVWCRDEWPETVEQEQRPLPKKRGEPQRFETVETVTPAGEALGIRYEELFALMFAGMNARIAALEAKLGG